MVFDWILKQYKDEDKKNVNVHVLAHSMGNQLLFTAEGALVDSMKNPSVKRITCASPDIPESWFSRAAYAKHTSVDLFFCRYDKALAVRMMSRSS